MFKNSDSNFRYQMLNRLKSDCDYMLNMSHSEAVLWAHDVDKQIEYMKELYESFPEDGKPLWISMEDINNYCRKMRWVKTMKFYEEKMVWDIQTCDKDVVEVLCLIRRNRLEDEFEEYCKSWFPNGVSVDILEQFIKGNKKAIVEKFTTKMYEIIIGANEFHGEYGLIATVTVKGIDKKNAISKLDFMFPFEIIGIEVKES